ncbi:MAG: tRNA (N6-isopentenyl adenosine(37)-C2)-methylthiotransferase MiaB [Bacillota bacterium]|nr:tRNA (N6-isopentenyl adenosine(37)-C2)-methylthiotransferase MiaB [Bacillota bacterium]
MANKYHIMSYGCQMNERDAETISGMLGQLGYEKTDISKNADVIIIHTCCVRESAENKIIGKIGELKHLKTVNPGLIIGICGCMVQQKDTAKRLVEKAPHIDLVFGTHNLHQLPELINQVQLTNNQIIEIWDDEGSIVEDLPAQREGNLKAYVTITYGCNNYCTYCIVPYVRGKERSRLPESIVNEIDGLGKEGFKEITLLGQNVNSYGKDLCDLNINFSGLLQKIDDVTNITRIRYMTSHPRDFNEELVMTVKNSKNVCPHFHLPLQAGSNKILKLMNRGYTKEQYLSLIELIKQEIPHASITTDLIVGFPGETEEDFLETLDAVSEARFDQAYTFLYSKRSGTPAATMENQVDDENKKARLQRLMDLQNKISLEINKELVNRSLSVLVEGPSKNNPSQLTGRTTTNKIVVFEGDDTLVGKLVDVKIEEARTWNLTGKLIKVY